LPMPKPRGKNKPKPGCQKPTPAGGLQAADSRGVPLAEIHASKSNVFEQEPVPTSDAVWREKIKERLWRALQSGDDKVLLALSKYLEFEGLGAGADDERTAKTDDEVAMLREYRKIVSLPATAQERELSGGS
jgi:hypothetical protein